MRAAQQVLFRSFAGQELCVLAPLRAMLHTSGRSLMPDVVVPALGKHLICGVATHFICTQVSGLMFVQTPNTYVKLCMHATLRSYKQRCAVGGTMPTACIASHGCMLCFFFMSLHSLEPCIPAHPSTLCYAYSQYIEHVLSRSKCYQCWWGSWSHSHKNAELVPCLHVHSLTL